MIAHLRRRYLPSRERGQAMIIFAFALTGLIGMSGLLLDVGMGWTESRRAQNAADTAALAAAVAITKEQSAQAAANDIAATNGFPDGQTDCDGTATSGVTVNHPPSSGAHAGDVEYVEVVTARPMRTAFTSLFGVDCWMVTARAVAYASKGALAQCNLCSLNNTSLNHTLLLKNAAVLRVDGGIHTNSTNGGTTPGVCEVKDWFVCGDGFDVFGAGGTITAQHITVVGGWETHDGNVVVADALAPGCTESYTPLLQTQPSKVCVHMPTLIDPLNDPASPGTTFRPPVPGSMPVAGAAGCPSTALVPTVAGTKLVIQGTSAPTLCPGTYYGGIEVKGSARPVLLPGVYIMAGGGFVVKEGGGVDGSAGVLIANMSAGSEVVTSPGTSTVPPADPTKQNVKSIELKANPKDPVVGNPVTYEVKLEKKAGYPLPTGTADFYDGNTLICSAVAIVPLDANKSHGFCGPITYWNPGTRAISVIYYGDSVYNAKGDAITVTIAPAANAAIKAFTIETTGPVKLTPRRAGRYAGVTVYQDRTSSLTLTIKPGAGSAPACPADFMTAGLPNSAPPPCGAMGGIRGTIYAPHNDALVNFTASGLSNLQIMSGKILVDSGANMRLAYVPGEFAGERIRLVE